MIQKLLLLQLLLLPFTGFSEIKRSYPEIWIIKDSVSNKIHPDSMVLVFDVKDHYDQLMLNQHSAVIQVKIDGKTKQFTVTAKKTTFKLKLYKGKHKLSFYVNPNFEEIYFNEELKGGHYYLIGLNFTGSANSGKQIMVEKPVIYLYSETETAFTLKIHTETDLKFTYPEYKNDWRGTASSNGTIQLNGNSYPYLFWDAEIPSENLVLHWQQADQIEGKQTIDYFSSQLDYLGFNEKEKTDFITYWGPRLQQMKFVQVLWMQNEQINPVAALEISPAFKQNRVYMVFKEINQPIEQPLELKINRLKPMDRTGNYLIEWGGMEIQANL